jgi:hypothetical protein
MDKDITDISINQGVVTFSFMKGALEVPVLQEAVDVTESGFTMQWDYVPGIKEYEVRLDVLEESPYMLEGDRTEELLGGKAPAKVAKAKRQSAPMRVAEGVDLAAVIARSNVLNTRTGDSEESEKRYSATTIYTALTTDLSYRFDDLDGGLYRASVRSVRDSIYSRYSDAIDVLLVDSMLPQTAATFDIYIDKDSVYMVADSANVSLFYTTDGAMPTSYGNRYEGPFALSEKATIYAIAREPGHRRSEVVGKRNWFKTEGVTYRITSDSASHVLLSEALGGNAEKDYAGHVVVPDEVEYDSLVYAVVGIEDAAFRNATSLRTIQIAGSQLRTMGRELFHGCTALNAVMWDVEQPLTADMFDDDSYYNLLVYVAEGAAFAHPLVDTDRMFIVEDGMSGPLKLNDRYPFYCPRTFTAESVSYTRSFIQNTGLGSSAGWETIALPFDVQQVTHPTKGMLAPFGTAAAANFWLAAPSVNGFVPASDIQANKPYIIAMPNHKEYGDYSLSGQITFAAENSAIHATGEAVAVEGNGYTMSPSYEALAANDSVYVLNVNNKYETYAAGSVFVPNKYNLAPFTAYLSVAGGKQAAPYYRIQAAPDVDEEVSPTLGVAVKGGVVYVTLAEAREVIVYDAFGRKICAVQCTEGVNAITSLDAGIYVIEKTKVCVER